MNAPAFEDKYELETVPLRIGDIALTLYGVRLDSFVQHLLQAGRNISIDAFPLWIKVWEAAIVLADHLLRRGPDTPSRVLEIGAGMGVTGLVLAARGHRVTLTDQDEDALALLRLNARRNGLTGVEVRRLDWRTPDLEAHYDIVCAAECIYKPEHFDPLRYLFEGCLRPGGRVVLAHDVRRKPVASFLLAVAGSFEVETLIKSFRGPERQVRIGIHTLRPRKASG
jgi:predicted nicotinamide N-methyase